MRKGVHLVIGVLVFFIYTYLLSLTRETVPETYILGFLAIIVGSIMPDILEAPTSWRHRKAFHSKKVLRGITVVFGLTAAAVILLPLHTFPALAAFGLSCFAMGYLLHLLADSTTRRGLPE